MKSVTILEVAASAGISKTAASDILRGAGERFRPDTVRRVQEVALDLGYHANGAARLLAQHRKTLVGLSVILERRAHFNHLVTATHKELEKRGYHPLPIEPQQLAPGSSNAPFPDPKLLAGVISADLLLEQETPDYYARIQSRLPLVALYSTFSPKIEAVSVDHGKVVEMAAEHLAGLGHRRIAFVNVAAEVPSEKLKWAGWRRAVEKYRLDPDAACALSLSPLRARLAYEVSIEVVQWLSALRPRPTALICAGETIALSCLARLAEAGWKVPADISVVSYGADDHGMLASPPLTILLQPTERIAALAAERLATLMEHPADGTRAKAQQRLIAPTLLLRGSTAACPR